MTQLVKLTRTPWMLISVLAALIFGAVTATQGKNDPSCGNPCDGACDSSGICGKCNGYLDDHDYGGPSGYTTSSNSFCEKCGHDGDPSAGGGGEHVVSAGGAPKWNLSLGSGPEYRKIGLNGLPLSDSKPQQEGESDYTPEETYVDALSLQLNHSVTDIFVPMASDQLVLQVRRSLRQENMASQNGPAVTLPRQPFGGCWDSNLGCGMKITSTYRWSPAQTNAVSANGAYSHIIIVTDENGGSHRFAMLHDGTYLPLPSNSTSIDVATISLTYDQATDAFTFTRQYGTRIVFKAGDPAVVDGESIESSDGQVKVGTWRFYLNETNHSVEVESVSGDTKKWASIGTYWFESVEYFQTDYVEDRYGYRLLYDYASTNSLVPRTITAVNPGETNSALKISIQINGFGHVQSVRDPMGNEITYGYTNQLDCVRVNSTPSTEREWGHGTYPLGNFLTTVARSFDLNEMGATTLYTYLVRKNDRGDGGGGDDNLPSSAMVERYRVVVNSITDANANQHAFNWMEDRTQPEVNIRGTNAYFSAQESVPCILRSVVSSSGKVVFKADFSYELDTDAFSEIVKNLPGYPDVAEIPGTNILPLTQSSYRNTVVTDLAENTWTYSFRAPKIVRNLDKPSVGTAEFSGGGGGRNNTMLFTQLQIRDPAGSVESYFFDPDAGMALSKSIDYSSNITCYAHTDLAGYGSLTHSANGLTNTMFLADHLRRPTSQTNALEQVRSYTYETNWNQKASITDELGRLTVFEFDRVGNRTKVTKYTGSTPLTTALSVTDLYYEHVAYSNFMTKQIVKDYGKSGDPGWVGDLVTTFTVHDYGKVKTKTVAVDGVDLTTTYDYDKNNNLIFVIDPNGNKTVNGYDAQNRLTKISFYEGSSVFKADKCFWYDLRGNKTWERDENGHYTYFKYDSRNNVTKTVRIMNEGQGDPAKGTDSYTKLVEDIVVSSEYNALGMLSATVDARGLRTEFAYDHLQRLTTSTVGVAYANSPLSAPSSPLVTSYSYGVNSGGSVFSSSGFKPTKVVDPRNYETTTTYDELYRPIETRAEITNGIYAITGKSYDALGNLRYVSNKVDAATWQITETIYNALNRPVKVIHPDANAVEMFYTSTGLKWKALDELDRFSTVEYDAAGRSVKSTSPALSAGVYAVTETGYDANGNVKWVKDANGNSSTHIYDYRNRVVKTIAPTVIDYSESTSPQHPTVSSIYDAVGNVVSVTDAKANTTTNFFDANHRMVETWGPEVLVHGVAVRPITKNAFDPGGNILSTTDANGKTVFMEYDAFGRLTNTVDAINNTISFKYDASGNQIALIDGENNRTDFTYDGLSRKRSTLYPGGTHEDAEYDLVGNRIQRTDCNGAVTDYTYDPRNRLQWVDYNNGHTRDYEYDLAGNLLLVDESTDANANVYYAYDTLNRVVAETSVGVTHQYQYDLNGNRTNAMYGATGRNVDWTYDALNRITQIVEGTNTTAYYYDLNGKPLWRVYPSGVWEARTFDAMGRLLTMATHGTDNQMMFDMTYTYDLVGSALQMVQTSDPNLTGPQDATTTWGYDDRYRLTNETVIVDDASSFVTNRTEYVWDHADNRLSKSVSIGGASASVTTYTNNALNQMVGYAESASEERFGHEDSLEFDGLNDFVEFVGLPEASQIKTMACWVKFETFNVGFGQMLLSKSTHGNGFEILVYNNQLSTYVMDGATHFHVDYPVSSLNTGQWYHIAATHNGSNSTVRLYIDGSEVGNGTCSGITDNGGAFKVGDWEYGTHRYFDGSIGDVQLFDTQLTASQIANLVSDGTVAPDNLLLHVPLTESIGSVAYDLSGLGNDGTLVGFSLPSSGSIGSGPYVTRIIEFAYDANGARTNKSLTAGDGVSQQPSVVSSYTYDEDNRLTATALNGTTTTHVFEYDYRSRRYYRSTPTTPHMYCVFDGGLSIQEYSGVSQASSLPSDTHLPETEFIRGEGMGGGVGGMVYSIKDGGTANEDIICSHANHRGDIIARSNASGSLTSFALYEAYGTRPYEWGDDPDRQKANTKEEETDLNLLNEGMRFRDLETGTFLTRDPIGYYDGPNMYCYVHCNPITHFDAFGLEDEPVDDESAEMNAEEFEEKVTEESVDPDVEPKENTSAPSRADHAAEMNQKKSDESLSGSSSEQQKKNEQQQSGQPTPQQIKDRNDPSKSVQIPVTRPPEGSGLRQAEKQLEYTQNRDDARANRPNDEATKLMYPNTKTEDVVIILGVVQSMGGLSSANNIFDAADSGKGLVGGVIDVGQRAFEFKADVESRKLGSGNY